MGIEEFPEIKLARRLFNKHSLSVPIDIAMLVKEYATLIYKDIPFEGVDGVSVNIKVPGKTPKIIINSNLPPKRQTFTLAHELGHIIIPWHLGTIVDDIYSQSFKDYHYSEIEHEANRFAAELLMPRDWILSTISRIGNDFSLLHRTIANEAKVSDQSAAIRLIDFLCPNVIYTAQENGIVLFSGKSPQTDAFLQENGSAFSDSFYHSDSYSIYNAGRISYHWWLLSAEIDIKTDDNRTWRVILDKITDDIKPKEGSEKFKKSINGIIANANGKLIRQGNHSVKTLISSAINRLKRPELNDFTSHPDFEKFVKIKVEDLLNKK
jgi:Zn-dependent peptidase ImmA (M78 family)